MELSLHGSKVGRVLPAGSSGPAALAGMASIPRLLVTWSLGQLGWGGHLLGRGRGPQGEAAARFNSCFCPDLLPGPGISTHL